MTPEDLDKEIDDLELDEMSEKEITRTVSAMSTEGLALRRARKSVRYRLARIQTMVSGGPDAEDTEGLKEKFEAMPLFGGWRFYGITWDVALGDPFEIVSRDHSQIEEWNALMQSKFPTLNHDGSVSYPDITVKEKVEAATKPKKRGTDK